MPKKGIAAMNKGSPQLYPSNAKELRFHQSPGVLKRNPENVYNKGVLHLFAKQDGVLEGWAST